MDEALLCSHLPGHLDVPEGHMGRNWAFLLDGLPDLGVEGGLVLVEFVDDLVEGPAVEDVTDILLMF